MMEIQTANSHEARKNGASPDGSATSKDNTPPSDSPSPGNTAPSRDGPHEDGTDVEYEDGMTGQFAEVMVRQAVLARDCVKPFAILDNACGEGVVAAKLYELLDAFALENMQIFCGDIDEEHIKSVQKRIKVQSWKNTTATVLDAQVCLILKNFTLNKMSPSKKRKTDSNHEDRIHIHQPIITPTFL